jgi:hypothetical protein
MAGSGSHHLELRTLHKASTELICSREDKKMAGPCVPCVPQKCACHSRSNTAREELTHAGEGARTDCPVRKSVLSDSPTRIRTRGATHLHLSTFPSQQAARRAFFGTVRPCWSSGSRLWLAGQRRNISRLCHKPSNFQLCFFAISGMTKLDGRSRPRTGAGNRVLPSPSPSP